MQPVSTVVDEALARELARLAQKRTAPQRDPKRAFLRMMHMARSGAGATLADYERFIGENELLPVNFLERGLMAARPVCRIALPSVVGGTIEWGTGFMVSPRLMLTNNHVIPSMEAARRATIEFGYELDAEGRFRTPTRFPLAPDEAFLTDPKTELDFTLVAVAERAEDRRTTLDSVGFLRLDAAIGKIDPGEFVNIIQHAGSEDKRIAFRENRVLKLGDQPYAAADHYLWYGADTAKGSSGAPVCNDSWQVVALHHAAVPVSRQREGRTEYQLADDRTWLPREEAEALPDDRVKWVANQGVRVSRLVTRAGDRMRDAGGAVSTLLADWLADARGERPFPGVAPGVSLVGPAPAQPAAPAIVATSEEAKRGRPRPKVRPAAAFAGRQGYRPDFLGVEIPLPRPSAPTIAARGAIAPVDGAQDGEARYQNFSVLMNAARRLAYVSAVNIAGDRWVGLERDADQWFFDGRIAMEAQIGDALYSDEPNDIPGANQGWFDRGHLTRRQDPLWGATNEVLLANEDTFHWTNCAPQYWGFNRGFGARGSTNGRRLWNGLEEFVLQNTKAERIAVSVFNGPVLLEDDEVHRGVKIPRIFFKIVACRGPDGALLSSGYLVSQERYATDIPFERLPVGPNGESENFQAPIARVAALSGLVFDDRLLAADVYPAGPDRPLESFSDVILRREPGV
jgi:endonuclease G